MRTWLVAAAVVVVCSHADAETRGRIRFGAPGENVAIAKLAVAIGRDEAGIVATLTIAPASTDELAIELPDHAAVTGVAIVHGRDRVVATPRDGARDRFDSGPDRALVQLAIAGQRPRTRVRAPVAIAIPATRRAWFDEAPAHQPLDRDATLYAEAPSHAVTITFSCGGGHDRTPVLDKADIRREIRRHNNAIQHCYEIAAQRDPTLAGTIELQLVIDPSGAVQRASIGSSNVADPSVGACMANEAARWRFHEGDATIVVNYPYKFRL
jgi:hypothetical protein